MGPGQKFLTRIGSGQPIMVWVRIWKISPKNVKFFNFFPFGLGQKVPGSKPGRPLIYCGSKVSSGRGPSLPPSEARGECRIFVYGLHQDGVTSCVRLYVASFSSHTIESRGLKFGMHILHIDGFKVTNQIFRYFAQKLRYLGLKFYI